MPRAVVCMFYQEIGCLCPVGLLKQNIIDQVAYKQQKFIFHNSGGQKSKINMPTWSSESLLPGGRLLFVVGSSLGRRGGGALWDLFHGAHSQGLHSHDLVTSQRPHLLTPTPLEFWRNTDKCGKIW